MTEAEIQNALWRECGSKRHRLIVPNVTLFGWESDLVSVTVKDMLCEYEIKCSRADFRKDLKKIRHRILEERLVNECERGPAYLFYVMPRDLVSVSEIPKYAGLIYSHPVFQVMRNAPRLHGNKITDHYRRWLERSITLRYWKRRLKSVDQGTAEDTNEDFTDTTSALPRLGRYS